MTVYHCTVKYCRIKDPGECARCEKINRGNLTPAQQIDLEERIAIRVIDGGQDEEEAKKKALAELEIWWEDYSCGSETT